MTDVHQIYFLNQLNKEMFLKEHITRQILNE